MMTDEQVYVNSRKTWLDKVLFYSFLPILPIFLMIGLTIVLNGSQISSATVMWAIIFGMYVPVVVACRTWYAFREKGYRDEFYFKNKKL